MRARTTFCLCLVMSYLSSTSVFAEVKLPKPPEGFDITLFGAPPEVNYPVCISAAPTGELFVGVDKQGSLGKKPGDGKVVMCVDTDDDGKADKFTTFAKMDHPRGLFYDNGSLWVLHPPLISVYHDDNRDGVADRSKVLVTGISTDYVKRRGADHTTNNIRMGIDGWLYIAVGDFGFVDATGTDGKKLSLRGGGVARVRPDGTELEMYAYGLRNIVDMAVDPRLNVFTRDNTNDGGGWDIRLSHIVQSGHYGYPSLYKNFDDELIRPLADYGGGSGCGAMYVSEPWLPAKYRDALLTCDWGRGKVFFQPLTTDEATFAAKQEDFLGISRPTDVDVDGIGNLYVSSWHGGKFNYSGENVGYVVQLRPKDNQAPKFPELAKLDDSALVAELKSASHVRRLHTQHEILRRGQKDSLVKPLIASMRSDESLDSRIAAIFTYKQLLGAKSHAELARLTKDSAAREYALRALADRKTESDGVPTESFVAGLRDSNPRVQVAATVGLARLGRREAAKEIVPLLPYAKIDDRPAADPNAPKQDKSRGKNKKPADKKEVADPGRVVPHVAYRALAELNAAEECVAALDGPAAQGAHRALRWMHDEAAVDALIEKLSKTSNAAKRREMLATLIRLYHKEDVYKGSWWGTRPDTTGPYYHRVKWEATPKIEAVIRGQLETADKETVERMLAEIQRHRIKLANLPGDLVRKAETRGSQDVAITIPKFDPNNPNQLGNIAYDKILAGATAAKGDAKLGARLFKQQSCIACHAVTPGQAPIGPQLVDIGKRYKRAQLIESIVKPSAVIAQGFGTNLFAMDTGKIHSGFVVREAADEVEIRTAEGKSIVLARDEIDERNESKLSVMPEGLVNNLTVEELASLLAYLESLKSE
ncbi:MAG: c-type cytochrome [Pirellulales bacterium]|nr:c-type cytochrome [Pirellulales bacterium]